MPAEFVNRKLRAVLAPIRMDGAAKLLVKTGRVNAPAATTAETVLLVDDCGTAPTSCVLVMVFAMTVPGGGICAKDAFAKDPTAKIRASLARPP